MTKYLHLVFFLRPLENLHEAKYITYCKVFRFLVKLSIILVDTSSFCVERFDRIQNKTSY